MYPQDNIFNIYYNIGRRVPFVVKRIQIGLASSNDPDYFHNKKGRTFLVEEVKPGGKGGKYGHAFGKCFQDGEPNNDYMEMYERTDNPTEYGQLRPNEIPCAGCGEWVLIEVPGESLDAIFPKMKSNDKIPFGKYKDKTYGEIAKTDSQYLFWLIENKDIKIDLYEVFGIDENNPKAEAELKRIRKNAIPEIEIDDAIEFGKYKGKSWREVHSLDPGYIQWALNNMNNKKFNLESFATLLKN